MEKISGIIPASPRTRVVDTSNAQPARPGAPSFGRPMGKNSLGDRITLSKIAEEMRAAEALNPSQEGLEVKAPQGLPAKGAMTAQQSQNTTATAQADTYKPSPEAKRVKVVEDLNKKFFEKPFEISRENGAATASEEALNRYNNVKNLKPDIEAQSGNHDPRANTDGAPL
jgi:hypothetical protein